MSAEDDSSTSHRPVHTMRVPGFALRRGVHHSGSELPRHTHDDPTVCYVMRGRFTEYVVGTSVDCVSDTLKLMPAGETHWNRFAADETRGLRIDVECGRFRESPAILRLLHERTHVRGERVGHIVQSLLVELDANDDAASLAVEGMLLELLALSVIALRAGFYDQSHFSNLFRRQFGVTPSAYRRAAVGTRRRDHDNS